MCSYGFAQVRDEDVVRAARERRAASDPREWSVAQVCAWLEDAAGGAGSLHREAFRRHKIDGVMLLQLEESDLEYTLQVTHSLHVTPIIN